MIAYRARIRTGRTSPLPCACVSVALAFGAMLAACAPLAAQQPDRAAVRGRTSGPSINPRYDAWQAAHPYTLAAWATHDVGGGGKLDLDYFLGSGLNTAFEGRNAYNSQRPMADLGNLPVIYHVYGDRLPDLEGFIADFQRARERYNLVALLLGDEVKSSFGDDGLTHMRQIRDWVANNEDPAIRSLLTLTCVPGGDSVSGSAGIRDYFKETCERIKPDVILPQFYPGIAAEGDTMQRDFYSSMEWCFNWARDNHVALWATNRAWTSSPPLPSESSLRLQRFANLAYGVRGMVDFLWPADANPTIKDAGYWNVNGPNPTVLYQHLAPINREIARLGRAMLALTPVRVYHLDSRDDGDGVRHWSDSDEDLPAWMRREWRLANVTGASNRNHVMVAFFRDDAGQEYFMVVNKDVGRQATGKQLATDVQLTFHPSVRAIRRLSRQTGEIEDISVQGNNYVVRLPGGTGDLFKFADSNGFAGVEEVTRPRLVQAQPDDGGSLPRLMNNPISFTFDGDASAVRAEIRELGADGEPLGADLGERCARAVSEDRRTVTYRENGAVF
jgi:hypothetical protein